jgi:predicted deacylase
VLTPILAACLCLLGGDVESLGGVVLGSQKDGPRIFLVAGIHGNEKSGVLALHQIMSGKAPTRGTLVIVPEANPQALAAGTRRAPGGGAGADMNRVFPGTTSGYESTRAAAIFTLARSADLTIDLHEEGPAWEEADLPTLVVTPASAAFALDLLDALSNRGVTFTFTGGAPAGSLIGELGRTGRSALVVEIPARLPEAERVRLNLLVVEEALRVSTEASGTIQE